MTLTTQHLVEASATIVTVTTLKRGDVYKRLTDDATPRIAYGIVSDVMHNGTDAAIQALEYAEAPYSTAVEVSRRVFGTATAPRLFAAHPDEFIGQVGDWIGSQQRKVQAAEQELAKASALLADLQQLAGLDLTAAETAAPQTSTADTAV